MLRNKLFNFDDVSVVNGLFCSEEEDMTRQEFKDEVNVNTVVSRHGLSSRPVQYGDWDFDQDLTGSMQATREVQAAYEKLPEEVRVQYPDMASVVRAIVTGGLKIGQEGVEVPSTPFSPEQAPEEGAR